MKKLILAAFLVCSFSALHAQKSFRFGLQGTGGLGWYTPDTRGIENDGLRLNYNFGLMTDFAISGENYWFASGVNLSNLQGKLKYPDLVYLEPDDSTSIVDATTSAKYNLNYVEVPIKLKMRTNEVGYMHYFGEFGIRSGINTRARSTLEHSYSGGTLTTDEEIDIADDIRLFRVGLDVAFGVEYNLTGNTYAVGSIRYHNGFTNLFNKDYYELDDDDRSKLARDPNNNLQAKQTDRPAWKAVGNNIELSVGIFF